MAHTAADVEEHVGWTHKELATWAVTGNPSTYVYVEWQKELVRRIERAIRMAVRKA